LVAIKTWSLLSATALAGFAALVSGRAGDRTLLVPGAMSDGHHQIELACDACHAPFGGSEALDSACLRCHAEQLTRAEDTHPRRIFSDPRNADRLARLDARRCVSCHREHWPEGTRAIGVTVAEDNCAFCHDDIGRERPSHAGLDAASCSDTGCHKYHDNRSTYEEFLITHAGENPRVVGSVPPVVRAGSPNASAPTPLSMTDADAPVFVQLDPDELSAWAESGHARGGVNCSDCHAPAGRWSNDVSVAGCAHCHADERAGWVSGKHGMRVGLGLDPMRPALARQPMQPAALEQELDCGSCHGAHRFDRQAAAVQACLGCHADRHSLAFADSPHARALEAELSGKAPSGSGVSCATCHLPRVARASGGRGVEHDQNANLRPREKMIRGVCLDCHGLAFALDALADPSAIDENFATPPARHVPSIDWSLAHARRAAPPPSGAEHDPPSNH
jgi:hypothetical protein